MSSEYIMTGNGQPSVFASTLEFLPDFWEAALDPQLQSQRLDLVMQRQREFVRSLGILPSSAVVELRITVNPNRPDPVGFAYLASIQEEEWAETTWRMFHAAFPADLDYRPRPVPSDQVAKLCDPLRGQAKHFYEWIPDPHSLALPDEQWLRVMGMPDYRPDQGIQLLRLLAQQSQPLVLGFTVQTIPASPGTDPEFKRIETMQLYWQNLLKDLDSITLLMRVPRGDVEVQERYGSYLEQMVRERAVGGVKSRLLDLVLHEWRKEGPFLPPGYLLEAARETALRSLQAGRHFLWRVHAAAANPLPPEITAAVEDEMARSRDGRQRRHYICNDATRRPEMHDLYTQIQAGGWQTWHDDPGAYEPAGEYIDDEGATALLSLPILPQGGIPGIRSYPANPFSAWQLIEATAQREGRAGEEMVIGDYIDRRATVINPRHRGTTLPINDLTRHALITGSTGAGKSTTCRRILIELARRDVPFLVIEPVKDEYGDLAFTPDFSDRHSLMFHRLAAPADSLWLNPFYIRKGISLDTHLSYVLSAFMSAFPLYGVQEMVLKNVMRKAYLVKAARWQEFQKRNELPLLNYGFEVHTVEIGVRKVRDSEGQEASRTIKDLEADHTSLPVGDVLCDEHFPTLAEVARVAKTVIARLGYRGEFQSDLEAAIQLRLELLANGIIGRLLRQQPGRSSFEAQISHYLSKPAIFQLSLIADKNEKALVMAFILTALYEYYELQPTSSTLRHVTLVEEAHVLLENISRHQEMESANTRAKAIELFVDMLAEIRSRGEGFVIAEQLPSKLVPEAIKNTNLKIMHRLTARDDREVLGAAMSLDERQSRFATTLEQGQAIIFREGLTEPALVRIRPTAVDEEARPTVTAALNSLRLNKAKNRRLWPPAIVEACKVFQATKNEANAWELRQAVEAWLDKHGIKVGNVYLVLWVLQTLHQESPAFLDLDVLRTYLVADEPVRSNNNG